VSIELIPQDADLIEEVASRIEESGAALPEALVVFPGKRPAHFLRRRLAAGRDGGFLPPCILSMDGLVNTIFDARSSSVLPAMEDIDAVALLHEIQLSSPMPLGGGAFMTLDAFFPLGLSIFQDLEELLIEGVPPEKVAEVQPLIEAEIPARSRARLAELARFYREFYPVASKRGLSTRASRYRAVCPTIVREDLARFSLVILAGFYALTSAELDMVRRMSAWPGSLLLFQDGQGMREKLDGYGFAMSARKMESAPWPEVGFSIGPDAHGQVFALSAALGRPGGDTAIVLPAPETLFPLLRHCLSAFPEDGYNVSLGYPLERTPLYGFFNGLMELIGSMDGERIYLPDYLAFVLHPYTKNVRLGSSAEATRVLFHALENKLATSRTRMFLTLHELESHAELFKDAAKSLAGEEGGATEEQLSAHLVLIHDRTIRRFRSFGSVEEFAAQCIELITWIHESSTAPSHPYFSPFAEEFIRSLEAISRSLIAPKSFRDTSGYFTLFRRYLRTRYHPFPGTPLRGLQVLGALETRCLRFDRVYVLDANEGSLPPAGAEDTLLPLPVRRALRLSTYLDREQITAYYFELLAKGAKEIHLFCVESGEKQKSRFVERLLWERQKREKNLDTSVYLKPIQYRVSLENKPPKAVEKTADIMESLEGRSFSATALDSYLRCPLAFYYGHVLGLGKKEETSGEIGQADIGTFVHDVLFRYFTPRKGRLLTVSDADRGAMETIVQTLFRERYGEAETGDLRLLRNQIRSHLGDFVDGYLGPLLSKRRVSIRKLESRTTASLGAFALNGRMDAMEERDDAPWVIDYKTAANSANYKIRFNRLDLQDRDTWRTAIPTLQLPLYLILEREAKNAMFLMLGRSVMNEKIELPLFQDSGEAEREMPRLEAVIMGLLEEIASPDIPFTPAEDRVRACAYCDFKTLCGTAWAS
jgi:hypothetical protein